MNGVGKGTGTSAVGKGTRACMILPAAGKQAEEVAAIREVEASPALPAPHSNILVVDDDVLIAMSTVAMIEDLGHQVIEAKSGRAALEIIKSGAKIDLMITDFSMPKMTGAELIEAARTLRPNLPVILASGYAELPGDLKLDVRRLGKPYAQSELAEQINVVLAGFA